MGAQGRALGEFNRSCDDSLQPRKGRILQPKKERENIPRLDVGRGDCEGRLPRDRKLACLAGGQALDSRHDGGESALAVARGARGRLAADEDRGLRHVGQAERHGVRGPLLHGVARAGDAREDVERRGAARARQLHGVGRLRWWSVRGSRAR